MDKNTKNTKRNINFVDLFCGIGGFHYAFSKSVKNTKCILASEIERNAIENYSMNFNIPKEKIVNILDIKPEEIKPNAIFAGFPCQSFSNAGFKKGFLDEERGNLFFNVMNIFEISRPEVGLLENVRHLISHDNGKTWKTILKEIKNIGYVTLEKPLILSPTDFGIPQSRMRVFIPMVRQDLVNSLYLDKIDLPTNNKEKSYKDFISNDYEKKYELDKKQQLVLNAWEKFVNHFQAKKEYKNIPVIWLDQLRDVENYPENCQNWKKNYLRKMWDFYENNKTFIDSWIEKYNVNDWKNKRDRKLEWQAGLTKFKDTIIQFRQSGIRCKTPQNLQTLVAMVQIPIIFQKNKWRRLTPDEIRNFQSFPKEYIRCENDFQSYKQFGNSVNVEVAEWVIKNYLVKYLKGAK